MNDDVHMPRARSLSPVRFARDSDDVKQFMQDRFEKVCLRVALTYVYGG